MAGQLFAFGSDFTCPKVLFDNGVWVDLLSKSIFRKNGIPPSRLKDIEVCNMLGLHPDELSDLVDECRGVAGTTSSTHPEEPSGQFCSLSKRPTKSHDPYDPTQCDT